MLVITKVTVIHVRFLFSLSHVHFVHANYSVPDMCTEVFPSDEGCKQNTCSGKFY